MMKKDGGLGKYFLVLLLLGKERRNFIRRGDKGDDVSQ